MNKRPFLFLIISILFVSLSCRLPQALAPTPAPSPIPEITLAPVEAVPTAVLVDTVTAVLPTESAATTETPVLDATAVPTEEPVPSPTSETIAAEIETAVPVADGEVFGPGQQDTRTIAGNGEQTYLIDGVKFTPRFIFAETLDEIDLMLAVEESEANFSGSGGAEVLVFTADENGRYDLIVHNQSDASGGVTLYMFDAARAVPGAVNHQNAALTAGETAQYQVESHGGRPVLIFIDPVDQSDIGVTVTTDDGQTVAAANYSGAGSAEAAFVLPRQTTRYTITVREVNNAPAQINVLLVPLE